MAQEVASLDDLRNEREGEGQARKRFHVVEWLEVELGFREDDAARVDDQRRYAFRLQIWGVARFHKNLRIDRVPHFRVSRLMNN